MYNTHAGYGIEILYFGVPPDSGALFWDNETKLMKTFNGGSGVASSSYLGSSVALNQETADAIEWVKRKMEEEKKLDDLCEQHPGLKECRNAFEVMKRLCEDK